MQFPVHREAADNPGGPQSGEQLRHLPLRLGEGERGGWGERALGQSLDLHQPDGDPLPASKLPLPPQQVRHLAQRGSHVAPAVGGILPPLGPGGSSHHHHRGEEDDLGDLLEEQGGQAGGGQAEERGQPAAGGGGQPRPGPT